MPSHDLHRLADKVVFGKSYGKLHRALDQPYLKYGPAHRKFFHDPAGAMFLSVLITGSPYPALVHLILDNTLKIPRTTKPKRK